MEHNSQDFCSTEMAGKTVLELGSGCGLAGLSFMVKGAEVTLTDLPQIVSQLTMTNAEVWNYSLSPDDSSLNR
jgi:predicted nicotinamide N-methyase